VEKILQKYELCGLLQSWQDRQYQNKLHFSQIVKIKNGSKVEKRLGDIVGVASFEKKSVLSGKKSLKNLLHFCGTFQHAKFDNDANMFHIK
jgi:hypothetical protein